MDGAAVAIVAPGAVDAAWLERALNAHGPAVTLAGFRAEPVGTGQLAETWRFRLDYAGAPPPGAPASVVGKFSCAEPAVTAAAAELGLYRAEVMFYRELAARAGIRTPRVHLAAIDDGGRDFVLLLEDLAGARTGNHLEGVALDDVERGVDEAARLHAATWNDPVLETAPWVYRPAGCMGFHDTAAIRASWQWFDREIGGALAAEVRTALLAWLDAHPAWLARQSPARCFTHGDFRADNMLFEDTRVCVVDWQTASYAGPALDLAYLVGGALPRTVRREREDELLRRYHARLCALGVTGYDLEACRADYRHYAFAAVVVALTGASRTRRTPRGDRLFLRMVSDAVWQAIDNGAVDALGV
ncbi:MAG: phosphotransferase [Gammaproteobacteria bacterium]|nr:phosphotransferase [Gammaproteobacteria bacterium]MCP5200368.1 phosphotransferase [Gammaproteobacteria bacterium]